MRIITKGKGEPITGGSGIQFTWKLNRLIEDWFVFLANPMDWPCDEIWNGIFIPRCLMPRMVLSG